MNNIYIKNNSLITQIYLGVEIKSQESYLIPEIELIDWSNDITLLTHITDGIAIVNDGSSNLEPVNGLNYIKGFVTKDVISIPTNEYSLDVDAVEIDVTRDDSIEVTQSMNIKIENHTGEAYTYKYLLGARAFGENLKHGDYITCSIVDVDGITGYPAGTPLKSFVRKLYVDPNGQILIKSFAPAKVNVGLYVTVVYHAVAGIGDAKVLINFNIFNKAGS